MDKPIAGTEEPVVWKSVPTDTNDAVPIKPEVTPPTQRRRPGRPRKTAVEGEDSIVQGPAKPRRARKNKTRAFDKSAVDSLAQSVLGIHRLISIVSGIPEMEISTVEAEMLAEAFDSVSREYNFAPSGKVTAVFGLIGAASIVYVPRAIAINKRLGKEAPKQKANVHSITEARTEPALKENMGAPSEKEQLDAIQSAHAMTEAAHDSE